ncbi:MAG TPA: hypothetical protein VFT62_10760 [Mycobacteriales bacterium]|nr:hypothetical protein [Mycobacteriales bacterium]
MGHGSHDAWLERRAWELARHDLERKSRRWYDQLTRLLEATRTVSITDAYRTGSSVGAAMAQDRRRTRLACLQLAVSDVVCGFTPEERTQLREHDALPADFVARVQAQSKVVRTEIRW